MTTPHRTYQIWLPYRLPPLTANQTERHWAARYRKIRQVKQDVVKMCAVMRLPAASKVICQLVYVPGQTRLRDPSNLHPTQKAAIDGLKEARVIKDDDPRFVVERVPRVLPVSRMAPHPGGWRLYLEVQVIEPAPVGVYRWAAECSRF